MLLSRVADALYWISRYLERAGQAARIVEVAIDLGLGRASAAAGAAADRLYGSLGMTTAGVLPAALAESALFDAANPDSVVSCVTAARENASQVREEISSDMWEQLNALFLRLRQMRADAPAMGRAHYLSSSVLEGVHLFQGITDATMGHGEGWQYLQAGRFLERATATAALLEGFLTDRQPAAAGPASLDGVDWVALLRACTALEAYCRHYTADVRPERVTEFLLLNAEFPRSIRFSAARVEAAILAIARRTGRRVGGRPERLAGRFHASLVYGQVDEILAEDPRAYLTAIGRQCTQIHTALYQQYVTYAIDAALPA